MSGQTPAPAQDFDDEKARRSVVSSQGQEQAPKPAVNAPGKSATRPQGYHEKFDTVSPETLARMHALREQDTAAGTRAPGAPFLEGAANTRSGSGTAMAINDGATAVHGLARSAAGKAAGKYGAETLGGDPAKFVAAGATVVQGVSQIVDANDSGRQAAYEDSKRGYEKSSINRERAFDSLRSLNMQKGDELTDEERENRSHVIRHAYKTSMRNIVKGLKTGALAKTTRNEGDLLSENQMKYTEGGQTDLAPGTVADKTHVVKGSMYGNAKRKYNDGDSQKLSDDRKTDLEALNAQKSSLEEKRDYELSLRGAGPKGRIGQSLQVYDPSEADADYADYFGSEWDKKREHKAGVKALEATATEELGKRKKKTKSMGITSSHQALLAGEQTQYDDSKAEYDSAASDAVTLREAHLKRHTDTYNELHKKTPGKFNKLLGTGAKPLSPEQKAAKVHAKAEMARLSTPHTLDNLKGYMSDKQLARATAHDRNMKNLESVRDTGLTLDQHDEMAEHKSGLAEIADRRKTGLSKGDNEELENTNKNIALVRDGQREHNETVLENLGDTVDAQGRLGGADHSTNDTSAVQKTMSGQAAQVAVSAANALRTGANIVDGNDRTAQKALKDGQQGVAVATGVFGMFHETAGVAAQAMGAGPANTKLAVAPATLLARGVANVLEGASGSAAEQEKRNEVRRTLTDGTRRADTRTSPVNWTGSTDHGQEPSDYSGMLKEGLTNVDESLTDLSTTYAAGREQAQDTYDAGKEQAQGYVSSVVDSAVGKLKPISPPISEEVEGGGPPESSVAESVKAGEVEGGGERASESPVAEPVKAGEVEGGGERASESPVAEPVKAEEVEGGGAPESSVADPEKSGEDEVGRASESSVADPEKSGEDEVGRDSESSVAGSEKSEEEEEDDWWSEPDPEGPESVKKKDDHVSTGLSDLHSQIHAAGGWSTTSNEEDLKKHRAAVNDPEAALPDSQGVADAANKRFEATKKDYNSIGSRLNRFSDNLTLRANNAEHGTKTKEHGTPVIAESGIWGRRRSVGRSLYSGAGSLFGGKARNYDDPTENRKHKEDKENTTRWQRFSRGAQNKWQGAKKFGKRIGSGIGSLFRRRAAQPVVADPKKAEPYKGKKWVKDKRGQWRKGP